MSASQSSSSSSSSQRDDDESSSEETTTGCGLVAAPFSSILHSIFGGTRTTRDTSFLPVEKQRDTTEDCSGTSNNDKEHGDDDKGMKNEKRNDDDMNITNNRHDKTTTTPLQVDLHHQQHYEEQKAELAALRNDMVQLKQDNDQQKAYIDSLLEGQQHQVTLKMVQELVLQQHKQQQQEPEVLVRKLEEATDGRPARDERSDKGTTTTTTREAAIEALLKNEKEAMTKLVRDTTSGVAWQLEGQFQRQDERLTFEIQDQKSQLAELKNEHFAKNAQLEEWVELKFEQERENLLQFVRGEVVDETTRVLAQKENEGMLLARIEQQRDENVAARAQLEEFVMQKCEEVLVVQDEKQQENVAQLRAESKTAREHLEVMVNATMVKHSKQQHGEIEAVRQKLLESLEEKQGSSSDGSRMEFSTIQKQGETEATFPDELHATCTKMEGMVQQQKEDLDSLRDMSAVTREKVDTFVQQQTEWQKRMTDDNNSIHERLRSLIQQHETFPQRNEQEQSSRQETREICNKVELQNTNELQKVTCSRDDESVRAMQKELASIKGANDTALNQIKSQHESDVDALRASLSKLEGSIEQQMTALLQQTQQQEAAPTIGTSVTLEQVKELIREQYGNGQSELREELHLLFREKQQVQRQSQRQLQRIQRADSSDTLSVASAWSHAQESASFPEAVQLLINEKIDEQHGSYMVELRERLLQQQTDLMASLKTSIVQQLHTATAALQDYNTETRQTLMHQREADVINRDEKVDEVKIALTQHSHEQQAKIHHIENMMSSLKVEMANIQEIVSQHKRQYRDHQRELLEAVAAEQHAIVEDEAKSIVGSDNEEDGQNTLPDNPDAPTEDEAEDEAVKDAVSAPIEEKKTMTSEDDKQEEKVGDADGPGTSDTNTQQTTADNTGTPTSEFPQATEKPELNRVRAKLEAIKKTTTSRFNSSITKRGSDAETFKKEKMEAGSVRTPTSGKRGLFGRQSSRAQDSDGESNSPLEL